MLFPRVSTLSACLAAILSAMVWVHPCSAQGEILVKDGEGIAFLGDTVTAFGWGNPAGYVKLVVAGMAANGIHVEPTPAGIGGQKSNNLLGRLDRDILAKKPQWMALSCGVSDVLQGKRGVPLDDAQASTTAYEKSGPSEPDKGTFEKNVTQIVDRAQAAGVKVVILTTTVIREDLQGRENQQLAPYNNFLRKLAKDKQCPLADVNALFQERLKTATKPKTNVLTTDGVHMNVEGNKLIAVSVLTALGFGEQEMKQAREAWVPIETLEAEVAKRAAEAKARADAEKAARDAATLAPAK